MKGEREREWRVECLENENFIVYLYSSMGLSGFKVFVFNYIFFLEGEIEFHQLKSYFSRI